MGLARSHRFYFAPSSVGERSIAIAVSVCLLSVSISHESRVQTSQHFSARCLWPGIDTLSLDPSIKNYSGWIGSRVVSVLDSGAEGPGFKSQSRRCRVTVLGKLFTPIVPLFTKQRTWYKPFKGCGGNCRPDGK